MDIVLKIVNSFLLFTTMFVTGHAIARIYNLFKKKEGLTMDIKVLKEEIEAFEQLFEVYEKIIKDKEDLIKETHPPDVDRSSNSFKKGFERIDMNILKASDIVKTNMSNLQNKLRNYQQQLDVLHNSLNQKQEELERIEMNTKV